MIKLGSYAKDKITGYEGVVVGRISYLTGCDRYSIQRAGTNEKGEVFEAQWFDEMRIEVDTTKTPITLYTPSSSTPPG